jgi:hypothetical protein
MAQRPEAVISTRQKYINIAGSLIVGASLLALGGTWKMIGQMRATINKTDVNTKNIEQLVEDLKDKNRVYHMRISENQEDIIMLRERTAGINERTQIIWDLIKAINGVILHLYYYLSCINCNVTYYSMEWIA